MAPVYFKNVPSEIITSNQNPKVKFLNKLCLKSSFRKEQGLFIVEGKREVKRAVKSGYQLEAIFYCPEVGHSKDLELQSELKIDAEKIIYISQSIFENLAYREFFDGVIALFKSQTRKLEDLKLSKNPLIIVVETVEKPGNLGAIFRTADAAKVDAIIVCDPKTDLYNPNVIRASVGCLFSVPFATGSGEEVFDWIKGKKINLYGAALSAEEVYSSRDYTGPTAIVVGSEADGLSEFWLKNSTQIKIPMQGIADSLNVSVSTAVIIFEAVRQRRLSKNNG
ncbi:rRNA methyltransferase [candidate division WWE3 bacterium CG_4_9_14_0_2_um_filter_35_11]|uniref:rRNA methyltransferase n=1 Tax=candidate division WWE3 bacterium CG_4_9_14_0_2_um_filter_35_11 TaxID=1975077 RepID=A0A2M8EM52_UNCKA|nr:MAG: rRNA methyltransferase [candidate division WWE3 bacterium CG10_big_fil_rev_8_21_14_0_10_35_32]PJC23808.1 MAG: rRNA methyltransferase [candidate division WWE3 bacterium CG_4_9_14_0_2_um_filter_35_11]